MSGHRPLPGLTTRAALASVATALFLLVLKGYATWTTGSMAMLGSLADSGLDLVASLVTLYAVRQAAQPADAEHRFGHGKAEALAALFQVMLITASAIAILAGAAGRLASGAKTTAAGEGIAVSLAAIGATLLLTAYQRRVIARTGSMAIGADRLHYQSDLMLNLAVIAALALDQYAGLSGIDPLFGIAIALWLAYGAWRSATAAIDQLMDKEWPEEKRRRLAAVVNALPGLKGMHDLRTRRSGSHDFIQFHIWVDPAMTVAAAHRTVEAAETALAAEFPGAEVLIHIDPEGRIDTEDSAMEALRETPE
ncbi:cation diffusion facilitator family transporter [Sphingomonas flavalba]|uniref:cation diffusion facilitator family transporter n=1 Tax=Sphingomonas flavalba TaxID=2559804 RepID=UPI0039E155AE